MNLQQGIRGASIVLPSVLRQLDATDGDIIAMSDSSLTVRAHQQLAIICKAPVLGTPLVSGLLAAKTLTVRNTPFYGTRDFATGDSLFIFYDGDSTVRTDDGWMTARIDSVKAQNCPDGAAGKTAYLNIGLNGLANTAGAVTSGSPVWGYVPNTFKRYTSAGKRYLGVTTPQGTQPLVETLSGANGLSFAYYDSTGAVTNVATRVAQIEVRLRAQGSNQTRLSNGTIGYVADSLVMQVSLRNNRRY
jgi:hypothetical protein